MMGYGYDPHLSERSLKPPLFLTSTFVFRSAEDGKAFFELAYGLRQKRPNEEPGLIYSRINNPDLEMLEDRLAIWDEAEGSLVFASGMAAISTTLWAYARPGTAILHSDPVYGGTDFLLKKILPQFGVHSVAFSAEGGVEAMQIAAEKAQKLGSVAAIYVETPANPTNGIVDIAAAHVLAEHLATDGLSLLIIRFSVRSIKRPWHLVRISLSLRSRNMSAAIPISSRAVVRDQRKCCNRFAACEQYLARCATLTLVGC